MTRRTARPRGSLEREVLACLAAAGQPLTAAEVRAEIGADTAYTTVMTTLTRLHAKGALSREPVGRAYAYDLVGDLQDAPSSITARRMHQLLGGQANRTGVLTRFVAELNPDDEQLLATLLDRTDRTSPPGRKRA